MNGKMKYLVTGMLSLVVGAAAIGYLVVRKENSLQPVRVSAGNVVDIQPAEQQPDRAAPADEDNDELEKKGTPAIFDKDSAMLAVFGEYNPEKQATLIPKRLTDQWDMTQAEELATPLMLTTYAEGGQRKGVLVVQRQMILDGEVVDSHSQPATISVYIFHQQGRRWYYEKGNKQVVDVGSYGQAPEGRFIKLGDDNYGILFHGGYANMGYITEFALIVGLSDASIKELGSFDMGEENSGTCDDQEEASETSDLPECWSYRGELSFLREAGEEDYIVQVSYQGTGNQDGQEGVVDVSREEYYLKRGDSYTRIDAKRAANGQPVAESELEVAELEGEAGYAEIASPEETSATNAVSTTAGPQDTSGGSGPSFDCAQATSRLQQTICKPGNSALQAVERQLTADYDKLLTTLPAAQAQWLRESQRNWLEGDAGCAEADYRYGDWAKDCLLDRYRSRLNELTLGVIINPIRPNQLPYRVVLPNGREGLFELRPAADEGQGGEELWFTSGTEAQPVAASEAGAKPGDNTLSLIGLKGGRLLLEMRGAEAASYHALDDNNRFVLQGQKSTTAAQGDYWIEFSRQWVAGDQGPRLQVDEHYQLYLHPNNLQRFYQFRFDGRPWEEQLPEPHFWLDKPDAAARYTALYREIVATKKPLSAAPDDCYERGIDWTLASASLAHWLDVVLEAQARGVAYEHAPAIIAKVLAGSEPPTFGEGEREMFRALDYLRRKLEAQQDWQERLVAASEEMTSAAEGDEAEEVAEEGAEGLPYLEIGCLNEEASSFDYAIGREYWFNTFWLRRHADGTYAVAKQVVDYALHAKPAAVGKAR